MKLPPHVKFMLRHANSMFQEGMKNIAEAEDWLNDHGYSPSDYRCGDGRSLEEFELGTGNIDEFESLLTDIDNGWHSALQYQ